MRIISSRKSSKPFPSASAPTRTGLRFPGDYNSVTALAADGSLWYWPLSSAEFYYNNNRSVPPLLDISRKPQPLGYIFGRTD